MKDGEGRKLGENERGDDTEKEGGKWKDERRNNKEERELVKEVKKCLIELRQKKEGTEIKRSNESKGER